MKCSVIVALGSALAIVVGLSLPNTASAKTISGTNPSLGSNGRLYVPQATSGILGSSFGGSGKPNFGLTSGRVRLTGVGNSVQGAVTFDLKFTLSEPIENASGNLLLPVTDLDFLDQIIGRAATLREWVQIRYKPDPNVSTVTHTMPIIDKSNYGNYRPDGSKNTNNTKVTYSINLMTDLGLTKAEFDALNNNPTAVNPTSFGIEITIYSQLTRTKPGSATYMNTPESILGKFDYNPGSAPEPATMALLLVGVPILLRRKHR